MSLEDEIRDRLVADDESILKANLDRVEKLFTLHQDGTISINSNYRDIDYEDQILIYLIGQRFAHEGNLVDNDVLESGFFYKRMDKSDRSIRNYLSNLREAGFITESGQGKHRLVIENLPDALDRILGDNGSRSE